MFLSCPAKKARLTIVGQGTKEGDPKRMLLPALLEINITGKRVGLSTETQALLHGAVRFSAFTPAPAGPFREARPQWVFFPNTIFFFTK